MGSDLAHLVEHLQKAKRHFCYDHYQELILLVIQRPPATETNNVKL
ncbi:conserved hypothetical protein [Histoplasma capsulatum H143]|uniref:Uncharacterized protein n=1 Tax=Ajellomyces capsulatus (strain H143) TaxID=544712 RepID=C6HA60_AJECH|nr:conserved hypothetical protein [Histoplasma capsulatum H143]